METDSWLKVIRYASCAVAIMVGNLVGAIFTCLMLYVMELE